MIMLAIVLQIPARDSAAQWANDSTTLHSPLYREKLQVFTDRSLYASGEGVHFLLFNLSHPLLKEGGWSRVVYLELVNNRNLPVAQGKYRLEPMGARGILTIPDTVTSGQYQLRSYTKWMRNFHPSEYHYLPLSVVNPGKIGALVPSGPYVNQVVEGRITELEDGILCSSDKPSYGKREKVTATITLGKKGASPDGYCISVMKKGTLDEGSRYIQPPESGGLITVKDLLYPPETRGLSVSGRVVSQPESKPVASAGMTLTLLGSGQDCFGFVTDRDGRIHFSIPHHSGSTDALITPDVLRDGAIEILMDHEFSQEFSTPPLPGVDFFRERTHLVEEIMVQSQIVKAFEPAALETGEAGKEDPGQPFYGTPEFRYRTDDYVALPNMEEFLFELVPQVNVIKFRDRSYIEVMDAYGVISNLPPLVLLDHVPLLDVEKLLPVSPLRIDHIDIINRVYIRGSNTYGGIVHIVSREGDRAGVGLPAGSAFISFSSYGESTEPVTPDYGHGVPDKRIPDLRTTLYWETRQALATGEGNRIEFYASDLTGEFTVVVRGITGDGTLLRGSCDFTVE